MPLTRAEAAAIGDTNLVIAIDGCRHRLRKAWANGEPGSLVTLYDLAVLSGEAVVRGVSVYPPRNPDWLELFPSENA